VAKQNDETEMASLLERFKGDPSQTRHVIRVELGLFDELAAEMFALVVFVSDGLLQLKVTSPTPATRFFSITTRLALELQMMLCYRAVGSAKEIIRGKHSEPAFKDLVKKL